MRWPWGSIGDNLFVANDQPAPSSGKHLQNADAAMVYQDATSLTNQQ